MAALIDDENFLLFVDENLDEDVLLVLILSEEVETTFDPAWPRFDFDFMSDDFMLRKTIRGSTKNCSANQGYGGPGKLT